MTPPEADLVRAIESTLHFYPPVAGVSDDLRVPGVHGRITALSHPVANLVGMAHLSEGNADAVIAAVKGRYAAQRKAFGWITGPGTTPTDLPARLEVAGLAHASSIAGMALTNLAAPIATNEAVRIEEIALADAAPHAEMMATAYGMPTEAALFFDGDRYVVFASHAGEERERLWSRVKALDDGYRVYEERTNRRIPVIALEPMG